MEELQEFWEWCGFRYYDQIVVENPNGEWMHEPDIDLNNLFKYAVPKLGVTSLILNFGMFKRDEWCWSFLYPDKKSFYGVSNIFSSHKDPAQALYQAIQKARRRKDEHTN